MPEKGDLRDFPAKDGKGVSCSLIVEGTSVLLSRDHERGRVLLLHRPSHAIVISTLWDLL